MVVVAITGAPGSGKTTVAGAICEQVPRAAHVQVDFFRKLVRAGYASPHHWDDEVTRQYDLARRAAAATASIYCDAGFLVVLDDIVLPGQLASWRALLGARLAGLAVLTPDLGTALVRNRERPVWTVDEQVLTDLHEAMAGYGPAGGSADSAGDEVMVLDNTHLPVTAAASRILARFG